MSFRFGGRSWWRGAESDCRRHDLELSLGVPAASDLGPRVHATDHPGPCSRTPHGGRCVGSREAETGLDSCRLNAGLRPRCVRPAASYWSGGPMVVSVIGARLESKHRHRFRKPEETMTADSSACAIAPHSPGVCASSVIGHGRPWSAMTRRPVGRTSATRRSCRPRSDRPVKRCAERGTGSAGGRAASGRERQAPWLPSWRCTCPSRRSSNCSRPRVAQGLVPARRRQPPAS
jgi:hypothetical protein